MGIQTLLTILKPTLQHHSNMEQFQNQTCVIDIMVWLYKGAFTCSYELATGKSTIEFLSYPLKMLRMLKNNKVKCICVFDGQPPAAKGKTEAERIEQKRKNKEEGHKQLSLGNIEEAKKLFIKSLTLESKMIELFMDILKELEI